MASSREQQLMDKIRQLLPDSKKKYTWADIEKVATGRERKDCKGSKFHLDGQITRFSFRIDQHVFRRFLHHPTTSIDRSSPSCSVFSVSVFSLRFVMTLFVCSGIFCTRSPIVKMTKPKRMKGTTASGCSPFRVSRSSRLLTERLFRPDQEERLMHLHQLADCLLLFKRTMGSIEALQKEDAALRADLQKVTNEVHFYQEEIASNREQIELVRERSSRFDRLKTNLFSVQK